MTQPHVHEPQPSVLGDGVFGCRCGWLSTDPPWLHLENAALLMLASEALVRLADREGEDLDEWAGHLTKGM